MSFSVSSRSSRNALKESTIMPVCVDWHKKSCVEFLRVVSFLIMYVHGWMDVSFYASMRICLYIPKTISSPIADTMTKNMKVYMTRMKILA